MPFSQSIRDEALLSCGRHCCICHKFCGTKIELHHILPIAGGGLDTLENCIPLCFDCHADQSSYDFKHPKGSKYTINELKRHKESWFNKILETQPFSSRPEHLKLDQEIFCELTTILPYEGTISFLKEFNFAGFAFEWRRIEPFIVFLHRNEDPAFEFIDADLEGLKGSMAQAAKSLIGLLNTETFATTQPGYQTVPPEMEMTDPEGFKAIIEGIHVSADTVCSLYGDLIRLARRKLAISPTLVNIDDAKMDFIESSGVLWKFNKQRDLEPFPYCISCKLVMSQFADLMLCSKCNFQAPFKHSETKAFFEKAKKEV